VNKLWLNTLFAFGVLLPATAGAVGSTTYPGFDTYKPNMPLALNANRHLVVTRSAPICKFSRSTSHPLGRVSSAQEIESLIRQGKKEEAVDLIDDRVTDGECTMSNEGDQLHVTGMLMADNCNGEEEKRDNVDQGLGVFDSCFYLPVVEINDIEYATLAVSLRNFDAYARGYLNTALIRKGVIAAFKQRDSTQ
jgi:hypothetical protein